MITYKPETVSQQIDRILFEGPSEPKPTPEEMEAFYRENPDLCPAETEKR